jgi:hypothetical protein
MDERTYYMILGVPRTESAGGIRSAYRDLAKKLHPDVAGQQAMVTRYRLPAGRPLAVRRRDDPARQSSRPSCSSVLSSVWVHGSGSRVSSERILGPDDRVRGRPPEYVDGDATEESERGRQLTGNERT